MCSAFLIFIYCSLAPNVILSVVQVTGTVVYASMHELFSENVLHLIGLLEIHARMNVPTAVTHRVISREVVMNSTRLPACSVHLLTQIYRIFHSYVETVKRSV